MFQNKSKESRNHNAIRQKKQCNMTLKNCRKFHFFGIFFFPDQQILLEQHLEYYFEEKELIAQEFIFLHPCLLVVLQCYNIYISINCKGGIGVFCVLNLPIDKGMDDELELQNIMHCLQL